MKHKNGADLTVDALDVLVTGWSDQEGIAVAVVNKDQEKEQTVTLDLTALSQLPKGRCRPSCIPSAVIRRNPIMMWTMKR